MHVSADKLASLLSCILQANGAREDVADATARGLVQASARGVHSHGIHLFPHYADALKGGRINGDPAYAFTGTGATASLDADHTFGHAAGIAAVLHAVKLARETGIGAVAVRNSSHFGAAQCFGLVPAQHDMLGLAFTNATPLMQSTGSSRSFFGANPICITAPMEKEGPFCLDCSTTIITWNRIKQLRRAGSPLPPGVAVDEQGSPINDPMAAKWLLPIGGHKGFGLSIAVDILCSLLTGMPGGNEVSQMYSSPISEKRYLGQFYAAVDIGRFQPIDTFKQRLQETAEKLRAEPPTDPSTPVLFPGDVEKQAEAATATDGIELEPHLQEAFTSLANEAKLDPPW